MEPRFDYAINFGTLVHLLGVLVGLVGVYWKMRELVFKLHSDNKHALSEIKQGLVGVETKVDSMWSWFTTRLERRKDDVE